MTYADVIKRGRASAPRCPHASRPRTLGAAAALLNERIDLTTIVFAGAVVLTVAIGRRMPIARV